MNEIKKIIDGLETEKELLTQLRQNWVIDDIPSPAWLMEKITTNHMALVAIKSEYAMIKGRE